MTDRVMYYTNLQTALSIRQKQKRSAIFNFKSQRKK